MRWTTRLAVLAMAAAVASTMLVRSSFAADVGDEAPAFQLPDTVGNQVALADYAGRVVAVVFYRGFF